MIDIGKKMRFIPYWWKNEKDTPEGAERRTVTGTVIYVNREHSCFTVEYACCGGPVMKETFKFSHIGKDIFFVRGDRYGR